MALAGGIETWPLPILGGNDLNLIRDTCSPSVVRPSVELAGTNAGQEQETSFTLLA